MPKALNVVHAQFYSRRASKQPKQAARNRLSLFCLSLFLALSQATCIKGSRSSKGKKSARRIAAAGCVFGSDSHGNISNRPFAVIISLFRC